MNLAPRVEDGTVRARLSRWTLGVAVASCLVFPAQAQESFADVERTAREVAFERRPPFGGVSETTWRSGHWSVNTFYAVFRGEYPRQSTHWVIRRVEGERGRDARVLWADSRTCPAVEDALVAMERIPLVRPDAPRVGKESSYFGMVMDGTHHTFWNRNARSGQNDATVSLEIEGNVNSPMAAWWASSARRLAACWAEMQPE